MQAYIIKFFEKFNKNTVNKVQIINLINMLVDISMKSTIVNLLKNADAGKPLNQDLIFLTITDLMIDFLQQIPDDKCYFNNGYIVTTPDVCGILNNLSLIQPKTTKDKTFIGISVCLCLCIIILIILVVFLIIRQK